MKLNSLTYSELVNLMFKIAEIVSLQTLIKEGTIKATMSRAEVEKKYGTAEFRKSQQYVKWQKKGKGRTSPVICQRIEFMKYMFEFNEAQSTLKNIEL